MNKLLIDLSLYLILDPDLCGGLSGMVNTARLAVENGATAVQLRAPGWKKRQWLEAARELKKVLAFSKVPLIINDQVDIALAVDADGVHVGQEDMPAVEARRLIGPNKVLGLSVSNATQLAVLPDGVDYLGIGPVYPTGTKLDAAAVLGVGKFAELVAAAKMPVVAIGGIAEDNCSPLFASGACGVAVISAICGQSDPGLATAQLQKRIMASRSS